MDTTVSVTYNSAASGDESSAISVEIGRPYPDPRGDWSCEVTLPGAPGRRRQVHGVDALQALCLAADLVRHELESYPGGLSWSGVAGPIPFASYRLGDVSAPFGPNHRPDGNR
jgi:hypothetical protein